MIQIAESDWIQDSFAQVMGLADVLTEPVENISSLNEKERDKIRNTQANKGESVRVLGHHQNYSLVMKLDKSRGWINNEFLKPQPEIKDFIRPLSPRMQPNEFLKKLQGVPYVWGGLSKIGVDCSGLTQMYFFDVFDKIIPRNSRDQRSFAPERPFSTAKDNDLVYGVGRIGRSHHVGLFLNSTIWHSYREEGVVCHSLGRFKQLFDIEVVNSVL